MEATDSQIKQAVAIVRGTIKGLYPDTFFRGQDEAGERIHAHYNDGRYAATVNYNRAWCEYEVLDRINDQLEDQCIPLVCEFLSSYECALEAV